jgi:hypothetical protein
MEYCELCATSRFGGTSLVPFVNFFVLFVVKKLTTKGHEDGHFNP